MGLAVDREAILRLAALHGARHVRLFGSAVRGESSANSDIDILVTMEPGRTLFDLIGLEQDLHELLGRSVDVVSDVGLSPYLRQQIIAGAVAL